MIGIDRILLVDDDRITNFLNKNLVMKHNFANKIVSFDRAERALEYLKKECRNQNQFPQLILLDLNMPGMNGFDFIQEFVIFCQDIKEEMIVVILSTSEAAGDVIKLKELGNFMMVNKPLTVEKLYDIHHRYFRDKNINDAMMA